MKAATPFIIIIICISAYFFYISPTLDEIKTLEAKKAEYTGVLEKAREFKAQRDTALTDYNNISEDNLDRLNKIVPNKFDSVLFANDINTIASKYGMSVKDLKYNILNTEAFDAEGVRTKSQPYKTIAVTFKFSSQYEQFIKFLKDLESSLQLVDVTSLSIKSLGGEKSTGNLLDYSLEVNAYSLK